MKIVGIVTNLTPIVDYYIDNIDLKKGDFCLVKTERGLEYGKVVEERADKGTDKVIVRKATNEDAEKNEQNLIDATSAKQKVKNIVYM